ncbi:MAG: C25 family cysteine peptidase [Candidatus Eisenbacteria bacterium]
MLPRPLALRSRLVLPATVIAIAALAALSASPACGQTPDILPSDGWVTINEVSPWSEPPVSEILASILDSISLTVDVHGFEVETVHHGSEEFQKLSFLGESYTSETGKPQLPVVRTMLAIPDCDSYSLRVELGDSTEFAGATVWPVPGQAVGYQDEYEYVYEVFAIDETFYEDDVLYPEGAALVVDDGWVRDQRYVILEIHPVRYDPALSVLRCYSSISVDLRFENPVQTNLSGVGPLELACRSVMANYEGVGSWSPRGGRADTCDISFYWCSTVGGCADIHTDYLMIVEDSIIDIDTLESLAEKKSRYDCLNVALVKVSDIANPIFPQAIKDFIQDLYETESAANVPDGHLGYVLLIGDAREAIEPGQQSQELLPAYEDSLPYLDTNPWVPTDHWYACVAGSDYVADLAIGRLAVGDTTELQTEVDKIVGYEPIPLSEAWTNDIFLSCSFAQGDPSWEGHIAGVHDSEIPAILDILEDESVEVGQLHVHEYDCDDLPDCAHEEYGRPQNIAAVNGGKLVMLLWGHGWPCGTYSFLAGDVDSLNNTSALPFWINMSCSTGNFANTGDQFLCGWDETSDCLGEHLMHWSSAGAAAFFGATRATGNHSFGRLILDALYDQTYPMIGQAVAEAKLRQHVEEQADVRSLCAYNLLGDPTLNLFLGAETGYGGSCDLVVRERDVVVAPELVNYDDQMTFECRVTNEGPDGTDPDEVVVAFDLYHADGQFSSRLTDTIGAMEPWRADTARVTWTPPADSVGAYDLFVTVDPETLIDELHEWNNTTGQPVHFYVHFYADGFPLSLPGSPSFPPMPVSPVTVCDLGGTDGKEIISAYLNGHVEVIDQSGSPFWSFTPGGGTSEALCPTVADFDRDGTPEVAVVVLGPEPSSGPRQDEIFVLNSEEGETTRVWKQAMVGETYSAPLLIDIDPLDGRPEVAVVGINDEEQGRLSVWDFAPQRPALSWDIPLGSGSAWQRTGPPTAVNMGLHPADLVTWNYTIDDTLVLCASATETLKWKLSIPSGAGHRGFGVAAGDLGQDGKVLLASARASDGMLIVHSSTSPPEVLWTASIPETSEVAIGNVDSDDELEIVCAGACSVFVFKHDYSGVPVWRAGLAGTAVGEPLIGDFDGGDDVEVIVGTRSPGGGSLLHILSVPATPGTLEPVVDPVEVSGAYATGAICDLDGDGSNDIVFATDGGLVHRLEYWGTSTPTFEWPMYRHDERNSGLYEQPVAGSVTQSTTWSGDMFMEGDIVVPENLTLHLAAGTEIEVAHDWDCMFSGRSVSLCELIVEGALLSTGGAVDRVVFVPDVLPFAGLPDWYGITLEPGSTCSLAFTDVSGACKSLWAMAPEALDVRDSRFLSQSMMGVHLEGCEAPTTVADCTIDEANIGIRADSCAVRVEGNAITGASQYGIQLYDDRGSTIEGNDITVGPGMQPLGAPRAVYCSNSFDPVEISISDNVVTMAFENALGEGICLYAVPQASADVLGNDIAGTGASDPYTKGIRLVKTPAVAHWNRLSDFYYHFYVECEPGQIPDLGDTIANGNNATDDAASYNIYAIAQPPIDPLPAQMNWWGTTDPSGRKFVGVGIDIEWEPFLEEDPGSRGGHHEPDGAVARYDLDQNRPNPFNPTTVVSYAVPRESRVRIAVYDLSGRIVRVLLDEMRPPGKHSVTWNGRNERGLPVGSGVYFCQMQAGSFVKSRKLIVLK